MKRMHLGSRCCRAHVKRNCRPAFTLVELLVVISIIGVLMGLLLPAIGAARETMRRTQCGTHLKNLALAAFQYEGAKDGLPAWARSYGRFAGTTNDPSDPAPLGNPPEHVKLGTWAVALLSYLDAQPTYEHWSEDRYPVYITTMSSSVRPNTGGNSGNGFHPLASPNLEIFQCPSNPVINSQFGKNSYIYNNGMSHIRTAASLPPMGSTSAGQVPSSFMTPTLALEESMKNAKSNGAGVNAYQGTTAAATKITADGVTLSDFKDGQGNTILFTENVQAMPWHIAGFIDASDLAPMMTGQEVIYPQTSRFSNGLVWHYEDPTCPASAGTDCQAVYQKHLINGGGSTVSDDIFVLEMTAANCIDLARPSSAHTDGVNCGMADGGTRFVADQIDYRVYQALLTPRGKSSSVPWPEYVLNEESF